MRPFQAFYRFSLLAAAFVGAGGSQAAEITFPVQNPPTNKYMAIDGDAIYHTIHYSNKVKLKVTSGEVFAVTDREIIVARRAITVELEPQPMSGWSASKEEPWTETRDFRQQNVDYSQSNNPVGYLGTNYDMVTFKNDDSQDPPDEEPIYQIEKITPYVRVADLQVDSLNQNPYGGVSGTDDEDEEGNPAPGGSATGKMVFCNLQPYTPNSEKPGWADFTAAPQDRPSFATMHLFLQSFPSGTQMRLVYNGSNPAQVTQNPDGSWFKPPGTLRVWTKNIHAARTVSDYIQPNTAYSLEDLNAKGVQVADGHFVFYVEGVRGSTQTADQTVKVQVKTPGTGSWVDLDTVSFTFLEVQVLDKDKNPIARLKVGKMFEPGVLSGSGGSASLDIEKDSDRFYLRIPGVAAMGATASLKVATVENPLSNDYDDNQTEIELEADGNDMISKSQLLVSDDIDDDHPVDGIADDVKKDRTHRIQLGGKFQITNIKLGNKNYVTDIRTPLITPKTVTVKIVILRDANQLVGGQPAISETAVWNFWKIVKERFVQVGVKVEVQGVTVEDPPLDVDLTDGFLTVSTSAFGFPLADEAKKLIEAYGTKGDTNDITIFYVNGEMQGGLDIHAGWAVADWKYSGADADYTYNAFIKSDTSSPVFGYIADLISDDVP